MSDRKPPPAVVAAEIPPRPPMMTFPEPLGSQLAARVRRPLGDVFGLKTFGVNLARIPPGGLSSARHGHSLQDEFVYVLEGRPVLVTDAGETQLAPGMCAGFPAGGDRHQLVNRTDADVVYLEIGDRTPGDVVTYADDYALARAADGTWIVTHKDGTPY